MEKYITAREAAELAGVTKETIYNLCKAGTLTYKLHNKVYEVVECDNDDAMLKYLLKRYDADIQKSFPGIDTDPGQTDKNYVVFCEGKPVGMSLGRKQGDVLDLKLDYSIPEYRDFSIGGFLFDYIAKSDIKKIVYRGPDVNHKDYLKSQGFVKDGDSYIKTL